MSPTATIAIAFYNGMPHLKLAIYSTLSQSYKDFELLLIDDGSTDGSLDLARSVRDARVRVFSDGINLGLSARLNQAVAAARGKYFVRMDADDVMIEDRLLRQIGIMEQSPPNTVLGGAAVCIDVHNKIVGFRGPGRIPKGVYGARHAFVHPTVCARTEWFLENKYDESIVFRRSEDAELWVRTYAKSNFVYSQAPCIYYRVSKRVDVGSYIVATLGLVTLATRLAPRQRFTATMWSGLELMKCWLTIVAWTTGLERIQTSIRYGNIADSSLGAYRERLKNCMTASASWKPEAEGVGCDNH